MSVWVIRSRVRPAAASSHVRYAPKATVGQQNAIVRDGPEADINQVILFDHQISAQK
jgi:hypothetical protein